MRGLWHERGVWVIPRRRLFDDILEQGLHQEDLLGTQVVVCEPLVPNGDAFGLPMTCDLPNLAPPFERMFLEADAEFTCGPDLPTLHGFTLRKIGAMIHSEEVSADRAFAPRDERLLPLREARWWVTIQIAAQFASGEISFSDRFVFGVRPDGRAIVGKRATLYVAMSETDGDRARMSRVVEDARAIWRLLAPNVSLMHCKNVELVERDPYAGLPKSLRKHGKRPLVRYHTLEIEPMRKVLRDEGGMGPNGEGLKQALHICRGHFKDYRQRGLFGKLKGLYWWDQHARGDVEQGVVEKDYAVKAPEVPK